jgi:hypothetical protein
MTDPFSSPVGADSPGPAMAVVCLNLCIALALVSVSLLLGLVVSMVALMYDRAREAQPVRLKFERRAAK